MGSGRYSAMWRRPLGVGAFCMAFWCSGGLPESARRKRWDTGPVLHLLHAPLLLCFCFFVPCFSPLALALARASASLFSLNLATTSPQRALALCLCLLYAKCNRQNLEIAAQRASCLWCDVGARGLIVLFSSGFSSASLNRGTASCCVAGCWSKPKRLKPF